MKSYFSCIVLATSIIVSIPTHDFCWRVEPSTKFSKMGVRQDLFLMGVAGKEQDDFFKGRGQQFLHKKNKLKSEIFNDKSSLQRKLFLSAITKNSNWEILTRIQLLLKDEMSLKRENFIIMWAHCKIHFLGKGEGGSQKIQYVGGNCLRMGAWTVCRFKGGGTW